MKQLLQAYGLLKKLLMMLYKNTKAIFYSPDGNTDFNIVAEGLQGVTLEPYRFMLCQDYVFQTSIDLKEENAFTLKKKRKK